MATYQTKPFRIEAVQWFKPGDHPATHLLDPEVRRRHDGEALLFCPHGTLYILPGEWIITMPDGGMYVCEPDVFAANYEPAVEPSDPTQEFLYTNHRGETDLRRVVPTGWRLGSTEYHADEQLLLDGFCLNRQAARTFAAKDVRISDETPTFAEDKAEAIRLMDALAKRGDDVCQTLGKALGYPRYSDDPENFPEAIDRDDVCVGEHVAETMAAEAADIIVKQRCELETLQTEAESVLVQLDNLAAYRGRDDPAFLEIRDRLRAALAKGGNA